MGNIEIIALDMDGTLLNNEGDISPDNREAIRLAQELGVKVILSTGRFIDSVREYAGTLDLSSYFITTNGSEIWQGSDQLIERHVIPVPDIEWLRNLAVDEGVWFWGMTTKQHYHLQNFPVDVAGDEWLKFGMDVKDAQTRKRIRTMLEDSGQFEVTNSSLSNIELNPRGVSKASGLKTVSALCGTTMDHVMAIGDSLNDIAMIRAVGCGVAMGNAQPAVIEAADWVTESNERHGVAQAIRRWVLNVN